MKGLPSLINLHLLILNEKNIILNYLIFNKFNIIYKINNYLNNYFNQIKIFLKLNF